MMYLYSFIIGFILLSCSHASACSPIDYWYGLSQRPVTNSSGLHRGINFGNMLDDPRPSIWMKYPIKQDFERAKSLGFDFVRLPVNFHAHVESYDGRVVVNEIFLKRVDEVLLFASKSGMKVILDVHHFSKAMSNPEAHFFQFVSVWEQVASRYKDYPKSLYFELLNEPSRKLTADVWNDWVAAGIVAVRKSNPDRLIVLSPSNFGKAEALGQLKVPEDDKLILSFHYYDPHTFTHQGVWWIRGAEKWVGTRWTNSFAERVQQDCAFGAVIRAFREHRFAGVLLGEFGVYEKADRVSRLSWISSVRIRAEKSGMAWSVWQYSGDFSVYNRIDNKVDDDLINALGMD